MAVKLGLWSLTLLPGESYPIHVRKDFQITNASLGEDLKSKDGRSVIKVTHEPLPAAFFEASDSEDEDDSDIEGDLPSDEFELDSEEGFKKIEKGANGDAAVDEEDDEEDEDFEDEDGDEDEEDDDEDMSDLEDDELLETTVLCALTAGRIEQASLNITFTEGDVAMFEVTGDNAVHLMGNYLEQFPSRYDDDSDSEFDSDEQDDYSDLELDDLEDEEDEGVPVKGRITEITEAPKPAIVAAKVEAKPVVAEKKRKAEAIDSPAAKSAAADTSMTSTDGLSKNQKKKLAKKAKTEESAAAPAVAPKKENAQKSGKKTLPNGLEIEDVKVGNGPVAKPGKRLQMRYIGKLTNGKQFDANTAGSPFSFTLGRGEVIKGWDQGLNGMAVGGERKLSIPAPLAYGKQKIPGIPPNSTLNFEVKLLSIK